MKKLLLFLLLTFLAAASVFLTVDKLFSRHDRRMKITVHTDVGRSEVSVLPGTGMINLQPEVPQEIIKQDGARMVLIPAGEFRMGSSGSTHDYLTRDERPVHTVYVDAFYMDVYEVTNGQYKKFINANPRWQKGHIDRRFHNGDYLRYWNGNTYLEGKGGHPVVYISWYAAMEYAKWAGKRLPTEAEWEKAARGGLIDRKYPWGNEIDSTKANYGGNVGDSMSVGRYAPNNYGLYDMCGNVWEWCLDIWDPDFYVSSPARNPIGGGFSLMEVVNKFTNYDLSYVNFALRGGDWRSSIRQDVQERVRVAVRFYSPAPYTNGSIGFRCVSEVVTP